MRKPRNHLARMASTKAAASGPHRHPGERRKAARSREDLRRESEAAMRSNRTQTDKLGALTQ